MAGSTIPDWPETTKPLFRPGATNSTSVFIFLFGSRTSQNACSDSLVRAGIEENHGPNGFVETSFIIDLSRSDIIDGWMHVTNCSDLTWF